MLCDSCQSLILHGGHTATISNTVLPPRTGIEVSGTVIQITACLLTFDDSRAPRPLQPFWLILHILFTFMLSVRMLEHPCILFIYHEVDIRSIPASNRMPHPEFTRQIAEAIKLCKNLKSFTCTVTSFRFLPYLENESELSELRITAQLSNEHFQATRLAKFSAIQSLSLLQGSWNVMNVLPRWSRSVQQTLTSLVLYVSAKLLLAITILRLMSTKDVRYPK